eukprot:460871_1
MSITTPRKKDEVECTICHKTQQYRSIDSHWAFEYRTHPSDTQHSLRYTVINNEDVAENNSDQDQDEDIEDSLSTTQQQIPQLSEFSVKCDDFLHKIAKEFLKEERSPYTSTTIKKKGSVLDRLLDDETLNIGVNIDFDEGDAYSESDEEQEDKRENEGETEQDALINICDMLSNGDDGDILSDGEMVGNIQSNIEHDEKMMELKDITEKKQRKRKINVLDDTNEPINMDKKRRKISSSKSNDVDNKQRIRRSERVIPSEMFSEHDITKVEEILVNIFRIDRTGQINKNKLLQQIQKKKVNVGEIKLEHILRQLNERNKIFYIDPMVHQI